MLLTCLLTKDLPRIVALEREHLQDPGICFRSSKSDILKSLQSGVSIGAFTDLKLIAYTLCYYNEYRIAFVEKCFVHPAYRGRGLQASMLDSAMNAMREDGVISTYTMASPSNVWSLRNFKARGFEVVGRTEIYGHKRLILKHDNKDRQNGDSLQHQ